MHVLQMVMLKGMPILQIRLLRAQLYCMPHMHTAAAHLKPLDSRPLALDKFCLVLPSHH